MEDNGIRSKKYSKTLILGYVNVVVSLVILVLVWNISGLVAPLEALQDIDGAVPSGGAVVNPGAGQKFEVSADDDPFIGNADAPVTIVEFSDFECPFCGKFYSETLPQLTKEYIDTGKVKLVYRDFPLNNIHPNAQKAAEASECADDQGKFWEMHDTLFENQRALSISDLKGYASDIGLDSGEFNDCLDSGKHEDEVKADLEDAIKLGVSGTPTFFINGVKIVGAQPFSVIQELVEDEL